MAHMASPHSASNLTKYANAIFAPSVDSPCQSLNISTITVHVPTGRMLKLRRSAGKDTHAGTWSIPGGKANPGETGLQAGAREYGEETGFLFSSEEILIPACLHKKPEEQKRFLYVVAGLKEMFAPELDHEHDSFAWCAVDEWPGPPHLRVKKAIEAIGENRILELARLSCASQPDPEMETASLPYLESPLS